MTARALIVGAGIVGAACARALARDGIAVTVIDARPPGSGATAAGMGHLVVMDDSPAQFALTHYSQQLWDELEEQLPADCEFDRCGTLWVAADAEEMEEVQRKHDVYQKSGVASVILSDKELSQAEPNLRSGLAGGLIVPGDSVIYPPCAARWLLEQAQRLGAKLVMGKSVQSLTGRQVILDDGTRLEGDAVVNAAGALALRLSPNLPMRPRKGHLVITDRYPSFVHHQILELGYLKSAHGDAKESVAFNVQPRKTGQLLLGSSRQYDIDTSSVDHDVLQKMIDRAVVYMPALVRLSALRIWTGFRAATPDSLPLLGPHPDEEGLYLATGHEGLGITTSLATAELLATLLTGKLPAIAMSPYLPARFIA